MHTVIVGGGFAGVKTALEISKKQLGKITLISDVPYFLHHEALYRMASGRDVGSSAISLEDIFASHHDVSIIQDHLESVDFQKKTAICKNGTVPYDTLVLALGSVTDYFGSPEGKRHSFSLPLLEQVRQFKRRVHDDVAVARHTAATYGVIGGGLTGVELAGTLGSYLQEIIRYHGMNGAKAEVALVEQAERLLPGYSKTAAKKIRSRLGSLGVKTLVNQAVWPLAKGFVTVGGKKISPNAVIWASGSRNNPFFAKYPHDFAIGQSGRVEVNAFLEVHDDAYVLGDNAATPFAGHAQTALHQAGYVARHLERKLLGKVPRPYRPRPVMVSVPVGEKWAYVEKYGVYAAGRTGYFIHRIAEFRRLRSLLPYGQAVGAWRAVNVHDEDCDLCNV